MLASLRTKSLTSSLGATRILVSLAIQFSFITLIPLNDISNIYFLSQASVAAAYTLINQPLDICYARIIGKSLKNHDTKRSLLPKCIASKIHLAAIICLIFISILLLSFIFCIVIGVQNLNIWFACLLLSTVQCTITFLLSYIFLYYRLEKRLLISSTLNTISFSFSSSIALILGIKYGVILFLAAQTFSSTIFFFLFVLATPPVIKALRNISFDFITVKDYISAFKYTVFTKSLPLCESLAISSFAFGSSSYYFLAKKVILSLVSVFSEGHASFVTIRVLHDIAAHAYSNISNELKNLRHYSFALSGIFSVFVYLIMRNMEYIDALFKSVGVSVYQSNIPSICMYLLLFVPFLCSNLSGLTVSEALYSLGLTKSNRTVISLLSAIFCAMTFVLGYFYSSFGIVASLSICYILNNIYISRTLSLRLR